MIRAIIFDLDNCLSAADEVGEKLLEPVFDAIRQNNCGRLSEDMLEKVFFDCWRHPLDWVAKRHGFPPQMLAAAWTGYASLEVSAPMRRYLDLDTLSELAVQRFLVTSGFRRMQESEVRALGFAWRFTAIYIDAIGETDRKGKEKNLQKSCGIIACARKKCSWLETIRIRRLKPATDSELRPCKSCSQACLAAITRRTR